MTLTELNQLKLSDEVIVTKTLKEYDLLKGDYLIYLEYHKERKSYNFLYVDKKGLTNILHLPESIHNNIEDSKLYQRLENLKSLGL